MPIRNYRPSKPIRWWHRSHAHNYETTLAAAGLLFGALLLVGQVWAGWHPSVSVQGLPHWQGYVLGGVLTTGSLALLVGVLAPLPDLEAEWLAERMGLLLSSLAWLAYTIALYSRAPHALGPLLMGVTCVVGHAYRLAVTYMSQRQLNAQVARSREPGQHE